MTQGAAPAPPRIRVLIAEDELPLAQLLASFLQGRGCHVSTVANGRAAVEAMRDDSFDVALLDIMMPEMDGLEVLRRVREEPDPPEVIIITGNATIDNAISAMKLGAYDYLTKPYRMAEIDVLVHRAWEKRRLGHENRLLQSRLDRIAPPPDIITQHPPLLETLAVLERAAAGDMPVLIQGESGTGKELAARMVHVRSGRRGSFVDVSCSMLEAESAERELLGHERGAFPGAHARRLGMIELAAHGTLLLDEVGQLSSAAQGKMLRVLEQGSFLRVGGAQKVAMDARLVCTTNRDLDTMVRARAFRDDLLFRINTVTVTLPPLRERTGDVALLAAHYLRQLGGPNTPVLAEDAVDALSHYGWPGNVRELRNVIERTLLLVRGREIGAADLPLGSGSVSPLGLAGTRLTLAELERRHIESVLNQVHWHQGKASETLAISPKTLYRKIREYGLARPRRA
ncbi:MAG: NtrC family two-component response regulator [Gemmatimonadetes bacterium]|nr:NtrC family two-component response regulator [Gemmatimonadota bacterium]